MALTEKIKANGVTFQFLSHNFDKKLNEISSLKTDFLQKKMKEAVTKNLSNCDSRRSPQWSRVWNLSLLN